MITYPPGILSENIPFLFGSRMPSLVSTLIGEFTVCPRVGLMEPGILIIWYQEGTDQYNYHLQNYGGPSKFGYKDFIPKFTAKKFDPDEWAEWFKLSGAQFAGPVGEHHDGFSIWDSEFSDWNAAKMEPKRDVVILLEKSIRNMGMRFLVALHHAENWWFYPHWRKEFYTSNPHYTGLYGEFHNLNGPTQGCIGSSTRIVPAKIFSRLGKLKSWK
jgi:alpha-L-fucosidase